MALSIGIVGLPNVGKSTLFNALLKKQVALAANYPFATIEPNNGIAQVPDKRLEELAKIAKTTVIKPAIVEFVDIAGLVRGASTGEGLGNKFLAHIRETSAICHVLRDFSDDSVLREGAVSPVEDLDTIRTELQLADLTTLEKQSEPKGNASKQEEEKWTVVTKFLTQLQSGKNAIEWSEKSLSDEDVSEIDTIVAQELGLITAKKEIFVVNVDENLVKNQTELQAKWAKELNVALHQVVIISAKIESELAVLSQEDQDLYLEDLGLEESGLERLAKVAYETLNLQSYLTAGEIEVRAWTISKGMTAPQAAGVIHTDFEKNFIKAKVVSYQDFNAPLCPTLKSFWS